MNPTLNIFLRRWCYLSQGNLATVAHARHEKGGEERFHPCV